MDAEGVARSSRGLVRTFTCLTVRGWFFGFHRLCLLLDVPSAKGFIPFPYIVGHSRGEEEDERSYRASHRNCCKL
jgi:hypothetical protein